MMRERMFSEVILTLLMSVSGQRPSKRLVTHEHFAILTELHTSIIEQDLS